VPRTGDNAFVAGFDSEPVSLMIRTSRIVRVTLCVLASVVVALAGCSSVEKAKPVPQSARVDPDVRVDAPEIMRGTVASEAVLLGHETPDQRGYRPIIVRGYGLVVGLRGTGSSDIRPDIRAYMLAQASKGGFGMHSHGENIANISPEILLRDPSNAVVVVEAIIPQGAVAGTRFDIRVYAERTTGTSSLEGGRLYTTELRPGPLTTSGGQAFALGHARGDIFINPFAEPGAVGLDTINRTNGRIQNGGVVLKDMPLKLRLINPSHTRAAILVNAINTRFPQEFGRYPGDPNHQASPTARGESDEAIEITVPPSWRNATDEFLELIRHTTIQQANPEGTAMYVRRVVLANPAMAKAAAVRWQALGSRMLPLIKDLYDYPEELPRMAALQAGAKLNDGLAIPHLITMSESGNADTRIDAIKLLAGMRLNPQIDLSLRKLLNDDDIEVRLEAYEALAMRRDPFIRRYKVEDKYLVDVVNSDKPLIYITQVGDPRIVLFGPSLAIDRPTTITAWSNRFMIKGDSDQKLIEVYYRDPDAPTGLIVRTEPELEKFAQFLGHKTSVEAPNPGLDLGYADAVGALHAIWRHKSINADFRAQQDRILAAILRQSREDNIEERPEFTDEPTQPDPFEGGLPQSDLGRLSGDLRPITDPALPMGDGESQPNR
jgi:hypothetical protein